jgi:hypothetical protein
LCKDEAGFRAAIVGVVKNSSGATGVLLDHLRLPPGQLKPGS